MVEPVAMAGPDAGEKARADGAESASLRMGWFPEVERTVHHRNYSIVTSMVVIYN